MTMATPAPPPPHPTPLLLSLPLPEVMAVVHEAVLEVLGKSAPSDVTFHELGGTSLDATELVMVLEERLSVALPLDLVEPGSTIAALSHRLLALPAPDVEESTGQTPAQ